MWKRRALTSSKIGRAGAKASDFKRNLTRSLMKIGDKIQSTVNVTEMKRKNEKKRVLLRKYEAKWYEKQTRLNKRGRVEETNALRTARTRRPERTAHISRKSKDEGESRGKTKRDIMIITDVEEKSHVAINRRWGKTYDTQKQRMAMKREVERHRSTRGGKEKKLKDKREYTTANWLKTRAFKWNTRFKKDATTKWETKQIW
jgi:hypothetical protein